MNGAHFRQRYYANLTRCATFMMFVFIKKAYRKGFFCRVTLAEVICGNQVDIGFVLNLKKHVLFHMEILQVQACIIQRQKVRAQFALILD